MTPEVFDRVYRLPVRANIAACGFLVDALCRVTLEPEVVVSLVHVRMDFSALDHVL